MTRNRVNRSPVRAPTAAAYRLEERAKGGPGSLRIKAHAADRRFVPRARVVWDDLESCGDLKAEFGGSRGA
jgi:hypothetical protein